MSFKSLPPNEFHIPINELELVASLYHNSETLKGNKAKKKKSLYSLISWGSSVLSQLLVALKGEWKVGCTCLLNMASLYLELSDPI